MGMAASQARYLALTARKTNTEWEGQQICQPQWYELPCSHRRLPDGRARKVPGSGRICGRITGGI